VSALAETLLYSVLLLLGVAVVVARLSVGSMASAADKKPNIVFILAGTLE